MLPVAQCALTSIRFATASRLPTTLGTTHVTRRRWRRAVGVPAEEAVGAEEAAGAEVGWRWRWRRSADGDSRR